ncbi:MAG: ferritin family protein [Thermodesulfobacteriota bacterium]|nr:ferritin family protein [Thermodesulfobacteriota bacterium]
MPNEFNADDIFEMAVQIEKNGAAFYRQAAEKVENQDHKKFLLELAAMEDDHEKTFETLKKELTENEKKSTVFDPGDENFLYLKALADMRVFYEKETPGDDFKDIVKSALQTEKDSIVFYLGMKELVSEKRGKHRLNDIIHEEMGHIRMLVEKAGQI